MLDVMQHYNKDDSACIEFNMNVYFVTIHKCPLLKSCICKYSYVFENDLYIVQQNVHHCIKDI